MNNSLDSMRTMREGNFKVIIRVRPLTPKEQEEITAYEESFGLKKNNNSSRFNSTLKTNSNKLSPSAYAFYSKYYNASVHDIFKVQKNLISVYDQEYKNTQKKMRDYVYTNVHGMTENNHILFETSLRDNVHTVLDGYNCTILAYGITGSGKTYSVFGHPKIQEDRGISHLAFQYLLKCKKIIEEEDALAKVSLSFSFIEIYNENIRDLLSDEPKKVINISEDSKGSLILNDVSEIQIQNITHISQLISKGVGKRIFASTNYNQVSSRSHAILRLNVEVIKEKEKITSKLFIIDLAGSEKIQMENTQRKQEGANINKSLLALGNCINILVENIKKTSNPHIPYRDSKLTRILKDSLGGNAKTIMIGCISPHPFTIDQSITTLNYAQRAQGIKKEITKNIIHQDILNSPDILCYNCHARRNKNQKTFQINQDNLVDQDIQSQSCDLKKLYGEMFERIYLDILENAKEKQLLQSLKKSIDQPCEQFDIIFNANEEERIRLKDLLKSLFYHKRQSSNLKPEECKSIKKQTKIEVQNATQKQLLIEPIINQNNHLKEINQNITKKNLHSLPKKKIIISSNNSIKKQKSPKKIISTSISNIQNSQSLPLLPNLRRNSSSLNDKNELLFSQEKTSSKKSCQNALQGKETNIFQQIKIDKNENEMHTPRQNEVLAERMIKCEKENTKIFDSTEKKRSKSKFQIVKKNGSVSAEKQQKCDNFL